MYLHSMILYALLGLINLALLCLAVQMYKINKRK